MGAEDFNRSEEGEKLWNNMLSVSVACMHLCVLQKSPGSLSKPWKKVAWEGASISPPVGQCLAVGLPAPISWLEDSQKE